MIKCEKYSSQVCNPSAQKIRILGSVYSFIKETLHVEFDKSTSTPLKSTPLKKCLLDTPDEKSPICKSVQVFSTVRKTTRKCYKQKSLIFGQVKETSEKESHDNLGQWLNIDNLPNNGFPVKVVLKSTSRNVLKRTPHDERAKCLARQICDQNLHAAASNITVKHSGVYAEVLNTVNKNPSDKNLMSDYLKSKSMLLQYLLNKCDDF